MTPERLADIRATLHGSQITVRTAMTCAMELLEHVESSTKAATAAADELDALRKTIDNDPLANADYARANRLYRKLGLGEVYAPAMRHQALLLREAAREGIAPAEVHLFIADWRMGDRTTQVFRSQEARDAYARQEVHALVVSGRADRISEEEARELPVAELCERVTDTCGHSFELMTLALR